MFNRHDGPRHGFNRGRRRACDTVDIGPNHILTRCLSHDRPITAVILLLIFSFFHFFACE